MISVYNKLPVSLQNIACSFYGYLESNKRFNKYFDIYLKILNETERLSSTDILSYQEIKMKELIVHSYSNVPYYKEIMDKNKLKPTDFRTIKDLEKMPFLTKEDVRFNKDKLISQTSNKRKLVLKKTSGTTGKSLFFYSSKEAIAFQWAIWWRHRNRFQVDLKDWHINFTGKLVSPQNQKKPPYWRWNYPMHQILFNMQHISNEKIKYFIDFLNSFNYKYFSGYPSIIYDLAQNGLDNDLKLVNKPKYIFTGAENTLEYQRIAIQNFTNADIYDQYGLSEGCANASQCEKHLYHEDFEFGIIEGIDKNNYTDDTYSGKLVCTGFSNYDFPFIRYIVGDTGTWNNKKCICGRNSKTLIRIEGRNDDFVLTPEGTRIMRFDYIFKDLQNVKESQIIQNSLDSIIVKIVKRKDYSISDEKHLLSQIKEWISPTLKVIIDYTNEIERTETGKFKAIISNLNIKK